MEIRSTLMRMRVGEAVRFPTDKANQFIEIERIFTGKEQCWVVYIDGKRQVTRKVEEVVEIVSKNWNPSLKKIMNDRSSELDEIVDLGEF